MIHPKYNAMLELESKAVQKAANYYRGAIRMLREAGDNPAEYLRQTVKDTEAELNAAVEDAVCGLRAS